LLKIKKDFANTEEF